MKGRCNVVNNQRSCSTEVMPFHTNNAIEEKLNDDDIHSDSSDEGRVDELNVPIEQKYSLFLHTTFIT